MKKARNYILRSVLFLTLYLSLSLVGTAQTSFRGKLLERESGVAVPYANIVFKNIGVISNSDGSFELILPMSPPGEHIHISSIGFLSITILLDTIKSGTVYKIRLRPSTVLLDEVVVTSTEKNLKVDEIVARAIQRVAEKNDQQEYVAEAFFRQTHFLTMPEENKAEYLRYVEAALLLHRVGGHNLETIIKEVRRSDDNREKYFGGPGRDKESGAEEERFKFSNDFLQLDCTQKSREMRPEYTKLYSLLDPAIGNLHNSFMDRHTFKLEKTTYYDDKPVYVVKILPSKNSTRLTSELLKDYFIPQGRLLIAVDDFSILEFQYSYIQNPKKHSKEITTLAKLMNQGDVVFQDVIKYKHYNGKMYPNYIMREQADTIFMGGFARSGLTRWQSDEIKDHAYFKIRRELILTNIHTEKQEINALDLTPKYFSLFPKTYRYNETFWLDYNRILPSQSEQLLLQDLGKGKSLEKQFTDNGQ